MGKREWAAGQQSAVPSSTILSYYTIFRHDWQGFYNNVYPVKLQALYQKPANCTKKNTKAAQESSYTALVSKEKRSMDEKTWGHVLVPGPCSLPENIYSIPGECEKKMN